MLPITQTAIQWVLNQLYQADASAFEVFEAVDGQTVQLNILDLNLSFALSLSPYGFTFWESPEGPGHIDCKLSFELFKTLPALNQNRQGTPSRLEMQVEGDIHLAQAMQQFLKQFEFSVAGRLAPLIGAQNAIRVQGLLDSVRTQGVHFITQRRDSFIEAIQTHEIVPTASEVNAFNESVDVIRDDVERLAIRISQLEDPKE